MPHLTQEFQYDSYQLGHYTKYEIFNFRQDVLKFAEGFRKHIVDNFMHSTSNGSYLFAPACFRHCSITSDSMFEININGVTLGDYLLQWFNDQNPERMLVDDCSGINCSGKCPYDRFMTNLKRLKGIPFEELKNFVKSS